MSLREMLRTIRWALRLAALPVTAEEPRMEGCPHYVLHRFCENYVTRYVCQRCAREMAVPRCGETSP